MKSLMNKPNPAFKRTQPLPLLSAELAQHAGWAARGIAQVLPLGGDWSGMAARAAQAVVPPACRVRVASLG